MTVPQAVAALDSLTVAIVRHADDAALGRLFEVTHHWHLIAAAERLRRREAAGPGRSAPPQPQERP